MRNRESRARRSRRGLLAAHGLKNLQSREVAPQKPAVAGSDHLTRLGDGSSAGPRSCSIHQGTETSEVGARGAAERRDNPDRIFVCADSKPAEPFRPQVIGGRFGQRRAQGRDNPLRLIAQIHRAACQSVGHVIRVWPSERATRSCVRRWWPIRRSDPLVRRRTRRCPAAAAGERAGRRRSR